MGDGNYSEFPNSSDMTGKPISMREACRLARLAYFDMERLRAESRRREAEASRCLECVELRATVQKLREQLSGAGVTPAY